MVEVPRDEWPVVLAMTCRPLRVWQSRDYLAVLYQEPDGRLRLSVNSVRRNPQGMWRDGITWDELQSATCDMSQSRRDTVACDPTGRGVDSIYDWCRERLEGADGAEDELYCAIMRAIEDYRHPELATARTVRAVDRGALLALADELDDCGLEGWACGPVNVGGFARRIREALGVVA